MAFRNLLKLLGQQPRQPWDERGPIGVTNEDLLGAAQQQAPTPYSQNINPTVRPAQVPIATPPITRPRSVMAGVKQAVTPTAQPATLDQALMSGGPTQVEQPQQQVQQQAPQQPISQITTSRNPYRDQLMQDEARLNQLETQPVGFWKRFGTGLLQRAITRRGEAPIPITKRQRDIEQTRGQLARDLKLGQEEGQMSSEEALQRQRELEPVFQQQRLEQEQGIQNARLEIERQKAAGEITRREADRQQKELDRQSREKIAAANVASREKVAGLRGTGGGLTPYQQQEIGDREAKREAARQAASDEYDQLVRDEVTAGKEKDRLYGVLKTIKENPAYPKEDLQQAQNDADEADKIYKSFAGKKRDALTRVRENQRATPAAAPKQQTQGGIYSGKRFSRAKVAERAKSLGMTPEQAEKTITAGGGIIY